MNEHQSKELERLPNLLPWVVGIAVLLLVGAYVWTFNQLPSSESPPAWGSFGDYVGGLLNPLVSTFTLYVAVKVWQLQKVELQQTKDELKKQAKTAEQQRQEQRFFDLLNVYYKTVGSLHVVPNPYAKADQKQTFTGKEAIRAWLSSSGGLWEFTREKGSYVSRSANDIEHSQSVETMKRMLHEWEAHQATEYFGAYLRTIEHILMEAEHLLGTQDLRYVGLFKAQLSRTELILIGFHLWLDSGAEKQWKQAEKYSLLSHLPSGDLRVALEDDLPPGVFVPQTDVPAKCS
ncbi:MAG: putative phage abortive infection protein [Hydrogenophaga sp.]|nr:putative phage abortive infection protein [Hydrogenophaga sp.]